MCCFAKLGGHKLLWIKVWELIMKPDWDAERWSCWESKGNEEEDVMVIDNEMDGVSHLSDS